LKILTFFILVLQLAFAEQLQIVADSFERNQQKKLSTFLGNVRIKTDKDELNASKVLVYVDEQNHPVKYIASGKVSFTISTDSNNSYIGRSEKLVFLPKKSEYQFDKDVFIQDLTTARTLSGESIRINVKTGDAKIIGKEKVPVRVTFELGDSNSSKKIKGLNNIPTTKTVKEK
jgi:lipopolysaccharide export system protein LptA